MNIKLIDIHFKLNTAGGPCCLEVPEAWYESKVTRVSKGEDTTDLLIGEVESGTVVECPHCGAKFLLNEQGVFEWVNPEEFDLVDAEETVAVPA